jgi:hypothetical protein
VDGKTAPQRRYVLCARRLSRLRLLGSGAPVPCQPRRVFAATTEDSPTFPGQVGHATSLSEKASFESNVGDSVTG